MKRTLRNTILSALLGVSSWAFAGGDHPATKAPVRRRTPARGFLSHSSEEIKFTVSSMMADFNKANIESASYFQIHAGKGVKAKDVEGGEHDPNKMVIKGGAGKYPFTIASMASNHTGQGLRFATSDKVEIAVNGQVVHTFPSTGPVTLSDIELDLKPGLNTITTDRVGPNGERGSMAGNAYGRTIHIEVKP